MGTPCPMACGGEFDTVQGVGEKFSHTTTWLVCPKCGYSCRSPVVINKIKKTGEDFRKRSAEQCRKLGLTQSQVLKRLLSSTSKKPSSPGRTPPGSARPSSPRRRSSGTTR